MIEIDYFYRENNQIVNDAIDGIITEVYKRRENGYQSFALTACGRSSGTTKISINLAIGLAACGWKVILVDCNLRKQERYKRLNIDIQTGLADYLNKSVEIQDITYSTNYDNMFYIPGGSGFESPVRLFCSKQMETLVETLKKEYQYIIYDMPPINVVPEVEIMIPHIDGIMLVTSIGQTTKKSLSEAKSRLNRYSEKYIGMIVNQVSMIEYHAYQYDYNYFPVEKSSYIKEQNTSTGNSEKKSYKYPNTVKGDLRKHATKYMKALKRIRKKRKEKV